MPAKVVGGAARQAMDLAERSGRADGSYHLLGVLPTTLAFGVGGRQASYTTMMMSTGLTFGSISALFGYTHGFVDRGQYSVLVTAVVVTALVPTVIAQALFHPHTAELRWGRTPHADEAAEQVDVA